MKKRDDYEQKREEIARVAAKLIATNDIKDITTQQIADECGASKGKIFHYFTSKGEILEAAFEWVNQRPSQTLQNLSPDKISTEDAESAIREILPLNEETELEWRVKLHYWQYMLNDPKTYQANCERLKDNERMVGELLTQYQRIGLIKSGLNVEEITWVLIDLIHGSCLNLLSLPMEERKKRVNSLIAYVRLIVS